MADASKDPSATPAPDATDGVQVDQEDAGDAQTQDAKTAEVQAQAVRAQKFLDPGGNTRPYEWLFWPFYDTVDLFSPDQPLGKIIEWFIRKFLIEPPAWFVLGLLICISISVSVATMAMPLTWLQWIMGNGVLSERILTNRTVRSVWDGTVMLIQKSIVLRFIAAAAMLALAPVIFMMRVFFDPMTARTIMALVFYPTIYVGLAWIVITRTKALQQGDIASKLSANILGLVDFEQSRIAGLAIYIGLITIVTFMVVMLFAPQFAPWMMGHTRPAAFIAIMLLSLGSAALLAIVHLEGHRRSGDGEINPPPEGPGVAITHTSSQFLVSVAFAFFVLFSPMYNKAEYARMRLLAGKAW